MNHDRTLSFRQLPASLLAFVREVAEDLIGTTPDDVIDAVTAELLRGGENATAFYALHATAFDSVGMAHGAAYVVTADGDTEAFVERLEEAVGDALDKHRHSVPCTVAEEMRWTLNAVDWLPWSPVFAGIESVNGKPALLISWYSILTGIDAIDDAISRIDAVTAELAPETEWKIRTVHALRAMRDDLTTARAALTA